MEDDGLAGRVDVGEEEVVKEGGVAAFVVRRMGAWERDVWVVGYKGWYEVVRLTVSRDNPPTVSWSKGSGSKRRLDGILGVRDAWWDEAYGGGLKVVAMVGGESSKPEDDRKEEREEKIWNGYRVMLDSGGLCFRRGERDVKGMIKALIKREEEEFRREDELVDEGCRDVCRAWESEMGGGRRRRVRYSKGVMETWAADDGEEKEGGGGTMWRWNYKPMEDIGKGELYDGDGGYSKSAVLCYDVGPGPTQLGSWDVRSNNTEWDDVMKEEIRKLVGGGDELKGGFKTAVEDAFRNTVRKILGTCNGVGGGDHDEGVAFVMHRGETKDTYISKRERGGTTVGLKTTVYDVKDQGKEYVVKVCGGVRMRAGIAALMIIDGEEEGSGGFGGEGDTWEERRGVKIL